jgi:ABC-2 type transport system permease protein
MKALSIAFKDLQILLKDRGDMFLLFLLPLFFIVVFSGALTAIGQSEESAKALIPLPVVDLDGGDAARTLIDGLNAAGGVRVVTYTDQTEATTLLQDKKIDRALFVPSGMGDDLAAGRTVTLRLAAHPDANAGQTEAVRLVVEGVARDMALEGQILAALHQIGEMQAGAPAENQAAFGVEKTQAQARSQFAQAQARPLVEVRQIMPAQPEQPVKISSVAEVAVPGMLVLFAFLTAQSTARSIYDEKKLGSFRRLLASPISKASLLAGKMLPNFITALIQGVIILAFGAIGLQVLGLKPVSLGSDPLALALVVVLIALCSVSLGILIAALAHTEGQIGGIGTLIVWGAGLIGGSIIPVFVLEGFGVLPKLVPHYWANRALDNLMIRGLGLADVGAEMFILLGFTALFFVVGLWKFDFE